MGRVGRKRTYAPYMTANLVISLTKIPHIQYTPSICGSGQPYEWALGEGPKYPRGLVLIDQVNNYLTHVLVLIDQVNNYLTHVHLGIWQRVVKG